jgi:predicted porin
MSLESALAPDAGTPGKTASHTRGTFMTFRISGTFAALAVLVVGHDALAGDFNYTYVQGGLMGTRVKAGGNSDGGMGWRLKGAISNNTPLFGFFEYGANKYSSDSDNLKFINASAGLGAHLPLRPGVDLVGGVSFERVTMKPHISYSDAIPDGDTNPSRMGLGLMAGMRAQAGDRFEWSASLKYRDMKKIDPIIGITVGGRYLFTPALSVAVDATHQKYDKNTLDATESLLELGVRYQFSGGG